MALMGSVNNLTYFERFDMTISIQDTWAKACEILKQCSGSSSLDLWLKQINPRLLPEDKKKIQLEVDNEISSVWIKENYEQYISDAIKAVTGEEYKFIYKIRGDQNIEEPTPPKGKNNGAKTETKNEVFLQNELSPKYTFETFVVGNNNNMAHASAIAVAQSPGTCYNPLFIHGGSGLGKTHLLQAIGNYVLNHKNNSKVVYISSESFTNEFIESLQVNNLYNFRKKYRHVDVLLIDDVQFLANKERIQEEFFHTFNALHGARKQIVMTCDRPIREMQNIQERLVTRFTWGLVTDMQPPDVETRIAILNVKAKIINVTVLPEVIDFIATHIRSDIRRLEGALLRIKSYQDLTKKLINVKEAENLLEELISEVAKTVISIEYIQKVVAEHFDIRLADMISRKRPEGIVFPRQIAMYLARELTSHSLNEIGNAFGKRDHGTVLHACKLVKDRMDVDQNVRNTVRQLEKKLKV